MGLFAYNDCKAYNAYWPIMLICLGDQKFRGLEAQKDKNNDPMNPEWVKDLKPFEDLFGISDLKLKILNLRKHRKRHHDSEPDDWEKIKKILQK